jgi:hypothetical protein
MRLLILLAAGILFVALANWLGRPERPMSREPWEPEDKIEPIDREALEAAEREVRDREEDPVQEEPGDDWGPGKGT